MSVGKSLSALFKKPVSLFFTCFGTLPFFLLLIHVLKDGEKRILTKLFNDTKEVLPFVGLILLLSVFLVMGLFSVFYWKKRRLQADTGNKFIPNISSFIGVLGIWLALWVSVSSIFVVFIHQIFNLQDVDMGLTGKDLGWFVIFTSLIRGLIIFIATKVILFLISKRWDIWNFIWKQIIIRFANWSKRIASDGARAAICVISIIVLVLGVCLVLKQVKTEHLYAAKKAVSIVSMEKISGGKLPDALSWTSSQLGFDKEEGQAKQQGGVSLEGASSTGVGTDKTSATETEAGKSNYSGIILVFIGLLGMGLLVVKRDRL